MARQRKTDAPPLTTAQQLGSLIKSARDIMRKDKGLSTDIDRLPMLTWIMFLKFLDDIEQIEEAKAAMRGERHRPAIEPPYRWRDWAANEAGITGPELLAFIQQDEAMRPDGTRGPGLFAHLRSLRGTDGAARRRKVIATVFSGVVNRMTSGYLLRDVLNKVNGIHFNAREELYTLGHMYESMLREMRDAAGENGEFYTPRPVVRFMVEMVDPRLGETVLDPACGTGGFLVEAYQHLEKQCRTVGDRFMLQNNALFGGEPRPLPYLLCQMNLLLHGLEAPEISADNSLAVKIDQLGDKDRVDVILTNPPFGGEEDQGEFPGRPADLGDGAPVPPVDHAQAETPRWEPEARARRHGRTQWHAVRRRRVRADQRAAFEGFQPAHHRAATERRVCALYEHPDQSFVLRSIETH